MPTPSPDKSAAVPSLRSSEGVRTLVSLLLVLHLVVVFVALSANLTAVNSRLQVRLLEVFRGYLRPLNFELDGTPYYLTHATVDDVDHRLEVLAEGADEASAEAWKLVVPSGRRGTEGFQRSQRYASMLAFFSEEEQLAALLAQAVAREQLSQGVMPRQVRLRKHLLQPWSAVQGGTPPERDPQSSVYFQESYRAEVIITGERVDIVRRGERRDEAQLGTGARSSEPQQ